jgi:DNA-binding NarL/FixJ family response regulator
MDSGSRPIRVFLFAEHPALRQNLALLLEKEGMVICGSAADPSETQRGIPADTDVVIVGLSTARVGALQLLREITSRPDAPPILVLSVYEDHYSIHQTIAAGASGYVPNRQASEVLAHAISEVVAGRTWVPLSAQRGG